MSKVLWAPELPTKAFPVLLSNPAPPLATRASEDGDIGFLVDVES